jgi:hypothetical protein
MRRVSGERAEESPQFALSKITPCQSFPRKRESSRMWTELDPRLRGGDNTGDFHLFGWAARPWTLSVNCAKDLASSQEESTGRRCKETAGMLRPPKNGVLSMTGGAGGCART